ncbi:MAG: hypothetical protein ACYC6T_11850 [Thermoleophilia bacterium]
MIRFLVEFDQRGPDLQLFGLRGVRFSVDQVLDSPESFREVGFVFG